jgi:hypothetical protein
MGDVVPGGTGMLTVAILRETRMPAVQVQISPEAASNQADLASGLADAIEAFLGPQETG